MPINDAHVGRRYPVAEPYEVTQAKIAEFARALGDDSAAYTGPDAVAPPTFAAVLAAQGWAALFADPDLGLELKRTIHYDQTFEFAAPLRAGDRVTTELVIDKVRVRGATAFVTVSAVLTTDAGVACTATSTLLHTAEEASA